MAQGIKDFTQASATLLGVLRGVSDAQATEVAKTQAQALVAKLQQLPGLSATEAAELATAFARVGFAKDDLATLLQLVMTKAATNTNEAGGKKGQSFEMFINFLPAKVWSAMENNNPEVLFSHLQALGLRRPSEPTGQGMAVALILASEGMDKALGYPADLRTKMVKTTKAWYLRSCEGLPAPTEWVWRFPSTPEQFKQAHPNLFAQAFADHPPITCKFDPLQYETLKLQTPMRAPKTSHVLGPSASASSPQDMSGVIAVLQQAFRGVFSPPEMRVPIQFGRSGSWNQSAAQRSLSPPVLALENQPWGTAGAQDESNTEAPRARFQQPSPVNRTKALPEQSPEPSSENRTQAWPEPSPQASGPHQKQVGAAVAVIMEAVGTAKAKRATTVFKRPSLKQEEDEPAAQGKKLKVDCKAKYPTLSHESTRNQYLGRTGLVGANQSKVFKYKSGSDKARAMKEGKAWCKEQCEIRGLEVPERFRA